MSDIHAPEHAAPGQVDFATRYTAAWCSQDPASVASFFAADGSLTINGGAPAVGRAAIHTAVQGFMTAFPDLRVEMENLVPERPHLVFHWKLSGTNTGPGGRSYAVVIRGFERWRFTPEGLIGESQGHFDEDQYQKQLGRRSQPGEEL